MNKMKYFFKHLLPIATLSILLTACQSPNQNFKKVLVQGGDFLITTYQKIDNSSQPFVFYIESDGVTYGVNGDKPSLNPTPIRQTFLELAAMDKRPNVVYVARPCQYTPMELNPKCDSSYWTNKRLSDDSKLPRFCILINISVVIILSR